MEKSLFEQMGGTYTQVGDYLIPNLRLPEQQGQPIGVWGQRHARYLKQYHKIIYMNLLTSGKLNDYLVDIENQAENMFFQIVKQLSKSFVFFGRPKFNSFILNTHILYICKRIGFQISFAEGIVYN